MAAITTVTQLKSRLTPHDYAAGGRPILFKSKLDSDPDIKAFFEQYKAEFDFVENQNAWCLKRNHRIPA